MRQRFPLIGLIITITAAAIQALSFFLGLTRHNAITIACFALVIAGTVTYALTTRQHNNKHDNDH